MTLRPWVRICLAIACLNGVACGDRQSDATKKTASSSKKAEVRKSSTVTYKLVGVVRRVDRGAGQVAIAHEAIPGFMGAMTMPFNLKDRSLLEDVEPGDEVEGPLRVVKEGDIVRDYELENLVVTRPAVEPPKTLSVSGRGIELRKTPERLKVGDLVPDFVMTTQEGKTQKLSDLRGEVVVLTFIYTRCPLPNFCPLMDQKFAGLADKVAANPERAARVRLVSLSFDPEHDTPEVLAKHASLRGAHPPLWTFAVATHPELEKVAAPLGLMYGPTATEIIHNLCTVVIDPTGRIARLDVGTEANKWQGTELLGLITRLLKAGEPTSSSEAAPKDGAAESVK